mmetsp:Transcript_1512/g.3393  ORF Transcript_1512/g.3393 Transcript_1512/m.3393 type:complete len:248 (-) Transcript_1512:97-840(-)
MQVSLQLPYTELEDAVIISAYSSYGGKWSFIFKLLDSGRTDNSVKNRFNCILLKRGSTAIDTNNFLSQGLSLTQLISLQARNRRAKNVANCISRTEPENNVDSASGESLFENTQDTLQTENRSFQWNPKSTDDMNSVFSRMTGRSCLYCKPQSPTSLTTSETEQNSKERGAFYDEDSIPTVTLKNGRTHFCNLFIKTKVNTSSTCNLYSWVNALPLRPLHIHGLHAEVFQEFRTDLDLVVEMHLDNA